MIEDLHILIGKIDGHLDQGAHLEETTADGIDPAIQRPGQLLLGEIDAFSGLGGENVDHRLGLGQIDAAIEEGPLGEFAGGGENGAAGENEFEDTLENQEAAVAMDLDDIFAGIGVGRGHKDGEDFIDDLAAIGGCGYGRSIDGG